MNSLINRRKKSLTPRDHEKGFPLSGHRQSASSASPLCIVHEETCKREREKERERKREREREKALRQSDRREREVERAHRVRERALLLVTRALAKDPFVWTRRWKL